MKLLENRVAIISGGTGALGRAVADYFVESGARVAIPWVVEPEVPLLKKRLGDRCSDANVFLKRADVGDEGQIATFVNDVTGKFGKLDILVNLVGGFWGGKSIADTSMSEWQAMFDLNLEADLSMLPRRRSRDEEEQLRTHRVGQLAQRPDGRGRLRRIRDRERRHCDVYRFTRRGMLAGQHHRQCDRAEHHRHRGESRRDAESQA